MSTFKPVTVGIVALGILPAMAGIWVIFSGSSKPGESSRRVAPGSAPGAAEDVPFAEPPTSTTARAPEPVKALPRGDTSRELPLANEVQRTTGPQEPTEEQLRIRRFDENARAFDQRLRRFREEADHIDEPASEAVEENVGEELRALVRDIDVRARCTPSTCVVEVTSAQTVGSTIAKIASWLREHPEGATGDPSSAEDQRGLRVVFERNEAPGIREK